MPLAVIPAQPQTMLSAAEGVKTLWLTLTNENIALRRHRIDAQVMLQEEATHKRTVQRGAGAGRTNLRCHKVRKETTWAGLSGLLRNVTLDFSVWARAL